MKIVGLVTEYNPFHNGHLYHMNESKKICDADYTIAVMSGNFIQRGGPAFLDKWHRTKMALNNGIDIVIELPTLYSSSSAEFFSYGAVKLLNSTGIVSSISFGSENGDINLLQQIATTLSDEPNEYKSLLKNKLNIGLGFADARSKALINYYSKFDNCKFNPNDIIAALSSPNNILGIEYLKALNRLNSSIKPYTLARTQSSYHDQTIIKTVSSASAIRNYIETKKEINLINHTMPYESYEILKSAIEQGFAPLTLNDFSQILNYILATSNKKHLKTINGISEGLENRILNCYNNKSITVLLSKLSTKRYTNTRLNRALLNIILNITTEKFYKFHNYGGPQYIKILGFKKESSHLLKHLKNNCDLPLISNVKDSLKQLPDLSYEMLNDEITYTDIYNLALPNKSLSKKGKEYTSEIIIL